MHTVEPGPLYQALAGVGDPLNSAFLTEFVRVPYCLVLPPIPVSWTETRRNAYRRSLHGWGG